MLTKTKPSSTDIPRSDNKQTLGRFLRRKRESLDPVALGVLSSGRRRTPGLRREEVAQLANIGTTWYTWLEQGRDIKTSADVLASVCQALYLTKAEVNYVFHLAELPVPQEKLTAVYQKISANHQMLLDQLMPYPAAIQTANFDILGYNHAFCKLLNTDLSQVPDSERNCLIQSLINPAWRSSFSHWDEALTNLVSLLRATVARNPEHPRNQYLVQFGCQNSAEFKRQWECKLCVSDFENQKKIMHHPIAGDIHFTQANWWSSTSGSATGERLMVYLPETDHDKALLNLVIQS